LLTPRFARGVLEALLGAALAVGGPGPALAVGVPSPVTAGAQPILAPVPAPIVAPPELPPLLDLDRPDVKPPAATPPVKVSPAPAAHPTLSHRVRPGDTLWGLAAAGLPEGSSAQQITRGWQEWYLANRRQIGPDPGLLLIGESLLVPRVLS
jgi:nucleoid-associated protein YgaU